jgi:uncharacterized membrane protein YphA (DoxX/SURF4 family)
MADATPKLAKGNKTLRTCTGWTILFMVVLRIAIGWHFFYEGAWKLMQDDWRATGYLAMALGPLRPVFSGQVDLPVIGPMIKDADGLKELTVEGMQKLMDERFDQLVKHYGLDGEKEIQEKLRAFTEARKGTAEKDPEYLKFVTSASDMLTGLFVAEFKAATTSANAESQPAPAYPDDEIKAEVQKALRGRVANYAPTSVGPAPSHFEVQEWLKASTETMLRRPDAGGIAGALAGTRMGYVGSIFATPDFAKQVEDYKTLLAEVHEYEKQLGTTGYSKERMLDQFARKARTKAACLATAEKPLKDLDVFVVGDVMTGRPGVLQRAYLDAKVAGDKKADAVYKPMLAKGLPSYPSPTGWIDWANMLALTAVGAGLMLGLFTRLSAVGGIGLLMLYYWCMPAFPWLPEAGPMEGHYLFVNKNLIEAIALAMIACSGVGRWAGLDAFLFRKRRVAKES